MISRDESERASAHSPPMKFCRVLTVVAISRFTLLLSY
jgi:hypothetical protein